MSDNMKQIGISMAVFGFMISVYDAFGMIGLGYFGMGIILTLLAMLIVEAKRSVQGKR